MMGAMDNLLSHSKKNAVAHKALAIGQIVISTGVAIMKAFEEEGPIIGGIEAGMIAITSGAQIAAVSQQHFADGGIFRGFYSSGDRNTARLNDGEMILNDRQQARLFSIADGAPSAIEDYLGSRNAESSGPYNFSDRAMSPAASGGAGGDGFHFHYHAPEIPAHASPDSLAMWRDAVMNHKDEIARFWNEQMVEKGYTK